MGIPAKSCRCPGRPPVLVEADPHLTHQLSGKAEWKTKMAPTGGRGWVRWETSREDTDVLVWHSS